MGLKGFHAWFDYRAARGQTLDPSADPNLDLRIWIEWLDDLACFAESKDNKTLGDVPKFTSFEEWKAWDELMRTTLHGDWSSITGVLYSFLIRLRTVVEPMMILMVWNTIDDDLVATTSLLTVSSRIDNCVLYNLLKPLFTCAEAWPFVHPFDRMGYGRGAYLLVKRQAEGLAALTTQKAEAYKNIKEAKYTGAVPKWTSDKYVHVHQTNHNKLVAW
jgi:hypothetical protein